jgi:hypothetical protein
MHSTTLPVHPTLIDPATGEPLEALAVIGGRPVWPVIGAAEDDETDNETDDEPDSPEEPDKPDAEDKKKPEPEPFDEDRAKVKIAKANKEAQSLRNRLKELEPLAAKAKELEDANKTETERLSERLSSAEERAGKAESELLRLRVAIGKGLTPEQERLLNTTARRLVGTTQEELEEDADDLLSSFASKDTKTTTKVERRPKERLRGGGDPDEPVEETDPKKLAATIPRR